MEEENKHNPVNGLLSLLRFTLKATFSIDHSLNPAASMWQAVLQYLRACPGCQEIYSAKITQAPEVVELLVIWKSAEDWRRFAFLLLTTWTLLGRLIGRVGYWIV